MERFNKSEHIYQRSIFEIRCAVSDIRSELDEIVEEYGDYTEDRFAEISLWNKPTVELEEWLDENESPYRDEEDNIYFDLAGLDEIMEMYLEASTYTDWFEKAVNRIRASIGYLV